MEQGTKINADLGGEAAPRPRRVLIVDDTDTTLALLAALVATQDGATSIKTTNPLHGLHLALSCAPDLILVDYHMPEMNGVDFVRRVRAAPGLQHVPIAMITGLDELAVRSVALEAGATDFLTKPIHPLEAKIRIRNLAELGAAHRRLAERAQCLAEEVAKATKTIADRERELIMRLSRAAEFRDNDTGDHLGRVGALTHAIARALGLDDDYCELLSLASMMHDVGKIGVSDTVLLKPGRLDPEERAAINKHASFGYEILAGTGIPLVDLAADIAYSHHEHWDGAGYPRNLAGEDIPLPARIVAIADVFDALVSTRPYKRAWSLEDARNYIIENSGAHFDPRCVEAFLQVYPSLIDLFRPKGEEAA